MNEHDHSPSPSSSDSNSRLDELLAERATEGLSAAEWQELDSLLDTYPDAPVEEYELAAAWLEVAQHELEESANSTSAPEPLPSHLRDRMIAEGRVRVRNSRPELPRRVESAQSPSQPRRTAETPASPRPTATLGWLGYAATALFGIAVGFLLTSDRGAGSVPADSLTPEAAYFALLERHEPSEVVRATWVAVDGSGVETMRGEIVWCDRDQEGYMRLEGLTPNEVTREQYQLWVVDEDRGHEEPVDGGVFDIAVAEGVQTIPIDCALVVDQPGLFVITREPRGGVVVSDGPFLATAKIDG